MKYHLMAYKRFIIDQNLKGIAHLIRLPRPWEVWNQNGRGRFNFWATPSKFWEKWYFLKIYKWYTTIIFGTFHYYKIAKIYSSRGIILISEQGWLPTVKNPYPISDICYYWSQTSMTCLFSVPCDRYVIPHFKALFCSSSRFCKRPLKSFILPFWL